MSKLLVGIAGTGCRKEKTVGCLLDVENTFDNAWHDGILFKLRQIQFPDNYLHLIASFLMEKTFCVSIDVYISIENALLPGTSV